MNENDDIDLDIDDDSLDDERGVPSVSRRSQSNNDNSFWVAMIILLIAGVGILWVFWPESSEPDAESLPAQVEQEFDREKIATLEIPELPDEIQEPVEVYQPPENPTAYLEVEAAPQKTQEKIAAEKAAEDLRERRKRSPLVVYDALSDRKQSQGAGSGPATQASLLEKLQAATAGATGGNILGAGEPDYDALDTRLTNQEVPTVTASYLRNRDSIIAQGKMIGAVLETAISSNLPGMVRAIVSESVYSEDGRTLLIEKGSRMVGEYRAGITQGQAQIFVIWNRVITPWGIDVQITSPGTGPLGRAGHSGWVDSHFLERFGSSILLSVLGAAAAQNSEDAFNRELGEGFNESAEIALENSINIRPTLHKNQGDRIKIFVSRDLNFKPVLALRSQ